MASPIGNMIVKLDMDSSDFNRGVTGARRDMKQVSSEMRANMSVYGNSGNELNKLGTEIDGMKKKYQVQAQTVEASRKKYEELNGQYDANSPKVQQAATDLNKQVAVMNEMENEISDLTGQYDGLKKKQEAQSKMSYKVGDSMKTAGSKMQTFGENATKVGNSLSKKVTLPIIALGTAAVAAAKKTGDHADEVINAAQKAGVSTDAYQELSYALKQNGLESADTDRALGRLNQRMGRAKDGNKKYSDALEAVGISQKDLEDGTYSTDEAFVKIIKSLQGVEDSQERSAMASEIFGTSMSRKLMPAINGGSEELDKLRGQAHDAGAVMGGEALENSQKFKFAMDDLKERGAGLVHELGAKLAPVLTNELIPAIEDKVIPALETGTEKLVGAVEWFTNLESSTQKNIGKFVLFAAAAGPVLSVVGKLSTGIGGITIVAGKLTQTLGATKGAGMVGSIAKLGKGGVVGLAIGGVAALSAVVYELNKRSKKVKEANIDSAQSFADQATELENTKNKFEKLSEKTGLTNDELARMSDLNQRISDSSNPDEIERLKDEYNKLAGKSGASKKELEQLWEANENLIAQSPNAKTAVSESGNEFVKHMEKVEEDIAAMREWSETKLANERTAVLEKQKEIHDKLTAAMKDQVLAEERYQFVADHTNDSKEHLQELLNETQEKLKGVNRNSEEGLKLDAQEQDLIAIKNGKHGETIESLEKQMDKNQGIIDKQYKSLNKLQEIDDQTANIYLQNANINKQGAEGLRQLDKNIEKHEKEKQKLEEKKQKNGELNKKDQVRLTHLDNQLSKEDKSKKNIQKQTGLYDNINYLLEDQNDEIQNAFNKKVKTLAKNKELTKSEQESINKSVTKNTEIDKQIQKLQDSKKEEGANKKEIQNQIDELRTKKGENNNNIQKVLEENGLWKDAKKAIESGTTAERGRGNQISDSNRKTDTGISKEEARTREAAKAVNKDINVSSYPTVPQLNRDLMERVKKPVTVNPSTTPKNLNAQLRKDISKNVNLNTKPSNNNFTLPLLQYAKGTKGHPFDGPAMVGDGKGSNAGSELITTPKGKQFLSPSKPTVMPFEKGTHVTPAKETKELIPRYAKGTDSLAKISFKELGAMGLGGSLLGGSFGNPFAPIAKGAISKMTSMFSSGNLDLGGGGTSSKKASSWASDIRRAAGAMNEGVTNAQVQGVIKQIQRESNGNPNIVQSPSVMDINTRMGNPARGLLQYIPQSFNAYKAPGHSNIYSGYDQLLAFFNNKNWRSDLPYGTRGWGPTGAKKYENGGISVNEKLAHISEGNKPEAIVPLSSNKRGRALDVLAHVADKFGVQPQPVFAGGDNSGIEKKLDQLISIMSAQAGLKPEINIHSPNPTSASENARQYKKVMQKMGVGL